LCTTSHIKLLIFAFPRIIQFTNLGSNVSALKPTDTSLMNQQRGQRLGLISH